MHQIEERKKMSEHNREVEEQRKHEYRKYGRSPQELTQYDRQKHLEEMNKYKEDLDKVKEEKDFYRSRVKSQEESVKLPL